MSQWIVNSVNDTHEEGFSNDMQSHGTALEQNDVVVTFEQRILSGIFEDDNFLDEKTVSDDQATDHVLIPATSLHLGFDQTKGATFSYELYHFKRNVDDKLEKFDFTCGGSDSSGVAHNMLEPNPNEAAMHGSSMQDMFILPNDSPASSDNVHDPGLTYNDIMTGDLDLLTGYNEHYFTFQASATDSNINNVVVIAGVAVRVFQNMLFKRVKIKNGTNTEYKFYQFVNINADAYVNGLNVSSTAGESTQLSVFLNHEITTQGTDPHVVMLNKTSTTSQDTNVKVGLFFDVAYDTRKVLKQKQLPIPGVWMEWAPTVTANDARYDINALSEDFNEIRSMHDPLLPFRILGIKNVNGQPTYREPVNLRLFMERSLRGSLELNGPEQISVGHPKFENRDPYEFSEQFVSGTPQFKHEGMTRYSELSPISLAAMSIVNTPSKNIQMHAVETTTMCDLQKTFSRNGRFTNPLKDTILDRVRENLCLMKMHIGYENGSVKGKEGQDYNDSIIYCDTFKYRLDYGIFAEIVGRKYTLEGIRMGKCMTFSFDSDDSVDTVSDYQLGHADNNTNGDISWSDLDHVNMRYNKFIGTKLFTTHFQNLYHEDLKLIPAKIKTEVKAILKDIKDDASDRATERYADLISTVMKYDESDLDETNRLDTLKKVLTAVTTANYATVDSNIQQLLTELDFKDITISADVIAALGSADLLLKGNIGSDYNLMLQGLLHAIVYIGYTCNFVFDESINNVDATPEYENLRQLYTQHDNAQDDTVFWEMLQKDTFRLLPKVREEVDRILNNIRNSP